MPSSYSTNLRLELQATGENKSTWGQKANTVFELIEEAVAGKKDVAISDANLTLTAVNGTSDQSRPSQLKFTGVLTAIRTITFPSVPKIYIIENATTGGFAILLKVGVTTYSLNNGQRKLIFTDGITIRSNDDLLSMSSATNRWGIHVAVDASGIAEAGRYIDFHNSNLDATDFAVRLETGGTTTDLYVVPFGGAGAKIWNAGNDGPASGLDADTVDGKHASEFIAQNTSITMTSVTADTFVGTNGANDDAILASGTAGSIFLRPEGAGSTTNQVAVDTNGNMTINGTLTVTG